MKPQPKAYECSACKVAAVVATDASGAHQVIVACKCNAPIDAKRTAHLKGTGSVSQ